MKIDGKSSVVDPEDGNCLEAPAFLDWAILSQDQAFVFVEVEPVVVQHYEQQPYENQFLVVAGLRLIHDKGEGDTTLQDKLQFIPFGW